MDNDNYPPPHQPPSGGARPPPGRHSSWQRMSPEHTGPPPPPAVGGRFDDLAATSPRSSRSSFVLDGSPSEPRSLSDQFTPEMCDEIRKLIQAGGVEGLKKRIVEEVGEQLKNGDSDGESIGSSPTPPPPPAATFSPPPPPPTGFARPPPPGMPSPPKSSFNKPVPFGVPPSGPALPHTPPASPYHGPQGGRPRRMSQGTGPPPPLSQPRRTDGRDAQLSPVDRCWGELFDADGKATKRLGQVLRGVANYLLSQSTASESVVFPPSKLVAFYTKFAVDNEPHPYANIFKCQEGDKEDHLDITNLYEDLKCEYHLVKHHPLSRSPPIIPALTPSGFVNWIIRSIYAYPDEEAARLHAIMSRLPIDADSNGKPERLPKQLSRHLLPSKPDKTAQRDVDKAVGEVLRERGLREKKERRVSYGGGALNSRPMSRRSESEPIPAPYQPQPPPPPSSRQGESDPEHQPRKKNVSFHRDGGLTPGQSSRRPSSERGGRPYNFLNGRAAVPASSDRRSRGDEEPISPTSPLPPPASPHFELSSGRDRERDRDGGRDRDREYRYTRDSTSRRTSGARDEVPRSSSGRRRRRKPEVVVQQDRGSSFWHLLREVSAMIE